MTEKFDCLIVGAGMAGLMAAHQLNKKGLSVLIFEKSRGVGGRMATRRFEGGGFDHGAQFFTVRSPDFYTYVAGWRNENIVRTWTQGFPDITRQPAGDGHPRYMALPGMSAVPKALARGLEVRLESRVTGVELSEKTWKVNIENEEAVWGRSLILTAPVPQSLELIKTCRDQLPPQLLNELDKIQYSPCIALLAILDGPSGLPKPGAVQIQDEPIAWIADNKMKGLCEDVTAVTVHAGPVFSKIHWDAPEEEIKSSLIRFSESFFSSRIVEAQLKKWRYAQPTLLCPERCRYFIEPAPIVFAGDAFGQPRVEGAALSGLGAAALIKQHLED